jgi:hypothetical protein
LLLESSTPGLISKSGGRAVFRTPALRQINPASGQRDNGSVHFSHLSPRYHHTSARKRAGAKLAWHNYIVRLRTHTSLSKCAERNLNASAHCNLVDFTRQSGVFARARYGNTFGCVRGLKMCVVIKRQLRRSKE